MSNATLSEVPSPLIVITLVAHSGGLILSTSSNNKDRNLMILKLAIDEIEKRSEVAN